MEKIDALEAAIQKGSLVGIYSVFYTIAHGDPNFSTGKFDENLAYVKAKNIPDFMQEFDEEEFKGESEWDEEYWAYIASSLIDNFCEVRINHLRDIGKKLYPNVTRTEQRNDNTYPNIGRTKIQTPNNNAGYGHRNNTQNVNMRATTQSQNNNAGYGYQNNTQNVNMRTNQSPNKNAGYGYKNNIRNDNGQVEQCIQYVKQKGENFVQYIKDGIDDFMRGK